jgi:DNA repair protein RecO (recombination protein O)
MSISGRRVELQPAYILHQRAYRDTSVLLELFTPEYGRVGLVARGARGSRARWRGLLQPFQPLLVSWILRGELGTLTVAEASGGALMLAAARIASGFYLNEILLRLLARHDPHLELFGWYDATLRGLARLSHPSSIAGVDLHATNGGKKGGQVEASTDLAELEILLRRFELRLLEVLGYRLVLDRDVNSGRAVEAGRQYVYHIEHGPVQRADADGVVEAGPCLSGDTLRALQVDNLSAASTRVEAKRLLRAVLGRYLGPKPLQSRHLLRGFAARGPTSDEENTP